MISKLALWLMRRSSRTCRSQVLPTRVTTGVSAAEQHFEISILGRFDADLSRRAEGSHLGFFQFELFDLLEKIRIARIGARVTPFDIVDAKIVELLRDAQLVFQRERNIFGLAAVSQSRIVK